MTNTIIFDLDDTLVNEVDYLRSAFREIAKFSDSDDELLFDKMLEWYENKENVFQNLQKTYPHAVVDELKKMYRNHLPEFELFDENRQLLIDFKNDGNRLGLITDGFSVTQRNKIKALGIGHLFDLIVISEELGTEKPDEANFKIFQQFGTKSYWYIADNVSKDFITPNRLGWKTVCLLNSGRNIHNQDFTKESIYLPAQKITSLQELRALIKTS